MKMSKLFENDWFCLVAGVSVLGVVGVILFTVVIFVKTVAYGPTTYPHEHELLDHTHPNIVVGKHDHELQDHDHTLSRALAPSRTRRVNK